MHHCKRMEVLVVALCVLAPHSYAQERCDLRILVTDYAGRPADEPVTIISDSGRVIAKTESKNGIAEVCDVGLGTFSAVIGRELCGQVVLRHLQVRPPSLVLRVLYENCHGLTVRDACPVLLRIIDGHGKRLSGAVAQVGNIIYSNIKSDNLGRIFFPLPFGKTEHVSVSLRGYRTAHFTLSCPREAPCIEESVLLEQKPTK